MLFVTFCLIASTLAIPEPWDNYYNIVSLQYQNKHFCSGALILDTRAIITAASCLTILPNNYKNWDIVARMGTPKFNIYPVRDVIIHPHFNKSSVKNDIALLYTFQPPIIFNAFSGIIVSPLSIGTASQTSALQALEVEPKNKIVNSRLLTAVGTEKGSCESSEDVICAKAVEVESDCGKDFGGPVLDYYTKKFVGITPYKQENCSQGQVEEFVRVEKHLPWIENEHSLLPWFNKYPEFEE